MEAAHWHIEILHKKSDCATLEALFEEEALAVAQFELDEKADRWRSRIYVAQEPSAERLKQMLQGFSYAVNTVEQEDWVASTQANFPPRRIGRFLVLGSHHQEVEETSAIPLLLDAGAAFGTGEHATTEGCLRALECIAKKRMGQKGRPGGEAGAQIKNILDMGCGSGILGIAAAKLIPGSQVLGVEIDPVATAVAAENAKRNGVAARCRMVTGNGYESPYVQGEYEIIFANILAGPLVKFAPALHRHLAPGGVAILSGLLNSQANWVLNAHLTQGLALQNRIIIGDWTTLVIRK